MPSKDPCSQHTQGLELSPHTCLQPDLQRLTWVMETQQLPFSHRHLEGANANASTTKYIGTHANVHALTWEVKALKNWEQQGLACGILFVQGLFNVRMKLRCWWHWPEPTGHTHKLCKSLAETQTTGCKGKLFSTTWMTNITTFKIRTRIFTSHSQFIWFVTCKNFSVGELLG